MSNLPLQCLVPLLLQALLMTTEINGYLLPESAGQRCMRSRLRSQSCRCLLQSTCKYSKCAESHYNPDQTCMQIMHDADKVNFAVVEAAPQLQSM